MHSRLFTTVRQSPRALLAAALALAAGCARHDAPAVDSSLARDLSMAGQTVPAFTPADTALNPNAKVRVTPTAPPVKTSAPRPAAQPRRAEPTRVATVPRPESPSPASVGTSPAPAPASAPAPAATGSRGSGLA